MAVATALALVARAPAARAGITIYQVTGVVTNVQQPAVTPITSVGVGDSYTAVFVIDNSVADTDGSATTGNYPGALGSYSLTVGSYTATGLSGGSVFVFDGSADVVLIRSNSFPGGPTLDGLIPAFFNLARPQDSTGTAFASDAIPNLTSLTPFDFPDFTLSFGAGGNQGTIEGNLTSLVPEPSTLTLLTAGLLGLVLREARRRRKDLA